MLVCSLVYWEKTYFDAAGTSPSFVKCWAFVAHVCVNKTVVYLYIHKSGFQWYNNVFITSILFLFPFSTMFLKLQTNL